VSILDALAAPAAFVLEGIHSGLATVLPAESGWTWSISIVLLTICVRLLIFPLFVKQVKSQRRMQEIAPKMKELQLKHKGDRETLNTELMKLYKEHGTNPVSGCMPLLLQMPVFFAMFRLMNELKPSKEGDFEAKFGLTEQLVEQVARAEFLGAPIASAFNSPGAYLDALHAPSLTVKVVTTAMIFTMGLTTFLTQKQMMARSGPLADPQQAQIQKFMLYVLPLSFAVFGFTFPVGLLLYQLVTNFWSMGQQHYVIKRMPVIQPGTAGKTAAAKAGAKGGPTAKVPATVPAAAEAEAAEPQGGKAGPTGAGKNQPNRGKGPNSAKGKSGSRKNKHRKGGRR
jgi:YidC/Oxa1 family membrane protein insertase